MTKRFKRRLCSVALSLSMLASLTPGTAFADEAPDGELLTELQGYSAEYPLGGVAFHKSQLEASEGDGSLYIDVVRMGAADGEASVSFKAVDVSAAYGEDYTLSAEGQWFTAREPERDADAVTLAELMAGMSSDIVLGEQRTENTEAENTVEIGIDAENGIVGVNELFSGKSFSGDIESAKDKTAESTARGTVTENAGAESDGAESAARGTVTENAGAESDGAESAARSTVTENAGAESAGAERAETENADAADLASDMSDNNGYISEFVRNMPGTEYTLNFDAGEYRKRIRIEIIDDDISETDEQVMFFLTDAQGAELAKPNTAYLNIVDNDEDEKAVFSLPERSVHVSPGDGYAYINIERISGIEKLASVRIGTGGITAEAGKDYRSGFAEVIFPQGVTSRTVKIPVYDAGRSEAVAFAVAIDGETSFADSGTSSMTVTIEPAILSKQSLAGAGAGYGSAGNAAAGDVTAYAPQPAGSLVYALAARGRAGTAGVIDGTVLLKDYPIFGEEEVIYTPINGAAVVVGGKSTFTEYDEDFGGSDGRGGDGYFKISDTAFISGESYSVNVIYKSLSVTAAQNVNVAQKYILDARDDTISVSSATRTKDGKSLGETEYVLSDDADYVFTLETSSSDPERIAEKAVLLFCGQNGLTVAQKEYDSTGTGTGVFECAFNPQELNLPAGARVKVQFIDSQGEKHFERDTGVTLMQSLETLSLNTSFTTDFSGQSEPVLPVIGTIDQEFHFSWDGTPDSAEGETGSSGSCSVVSTSDKKILNVGLEFSSEGDPEGISETEIKGAAENGSDAEKKQAAEAANKGENEAEGRLAFGYDVDLSFGLTLTLAASEDPEHRGEWCFEEFMLVASTGDSTKQSRQYVTPIGVPVIVGAGTGADGSAIIVVEKKQGSAEYYMTELTSDGPGSPDGIDLVEVARKNPDKFRIYGDFKISPYIGLSAGARVDVFNFNLNGRADSELLFDAETGTSEGSAALACSLSVKVLFFEAEYDLSSSGAGQNNNPVSFGVSDREYLNMRTGWYGGAAAGSAASNPGETTLMNGVNPNADTQMAALGDGKYIAVFIDDVPQRDKWNSTAAFYSIYDGSGWSEPVMLEDDGKADDSPAIFDLGNGKIFIAWSTADEVFNSEPNMLDALSSRNIHGCFYNISSGEMGTVIEITKTTVEDYSADYGVKLAYDEGSGRMIIYYTKSEYEEYGDGDILSDVANPYSRIAYRIYDVKEKQFVDYTNDEASEIKENLVDDNIDKAYEQYVRNYYGQRFPDLAPVVTLDETLDGDGYWTGKPETNIRYYDPLVIESDAISYGNQSLFAHIFDYDGKRSTTTDRDVFLQIYNFEENSMTAPIMVTSNGVEERSLQFEKIGDDVFLSYLSDGNIKLFDISNNLSNEKVMKNGMTDSNVKYYYFDKSKESGYIPERTAVRRSGGGDYTGEQEIVDFDLKSGDGYSYIMFTERTTELKDGVEPGTAEAALAENNPVETQIYAARYDIKNEIMSEPVRVTEEVGANYANVAFEVTGDGGFIAVATKSQSEVKQINGTDVSTDGSDLSSLCAISFTPSADVTLRDAFIEGVASGANASAGFEIYNGGLETIEGLTVEVKDSSGDAVDISNGKDDSEDGGEDAALSEADGGAADSEDGGAAGAGDDTTISLTGGARAAVSFQLPVAADANGAKFTAVVRDSAGKELDIIEYSASAPRTADVVSFHADITDRGVMEYRAVVKNNGAVASGERTFRITAAGKTELLDARTLESLAPGESVEITGRLDFKYNDLFGESVENGDGSVSADAVLTASAGGVSAADSLSLYASAEQMARLKAVQVAFKISEDEKVQLSAGSYFALAPEITSEGYDGRYEDNNETEIPAQGVKWMYFTDDDSIAKVDQNGRIEGVSEGTTTVTALLVPADSAFDGAGYVSDYPTLPEEAIKTYAFEVEVTKAQGSSTGSGTSVPTKPEPTTPPEPANPPESGFTDVEQSAWYSSAVEYVFDNGIMVGLSDTEFAPDADITRAMFATIVYRISGEQATASSSQFDDVADGMWYTEAIAWCAEKGIVLGVSDTEYDPDGVITREQMCAMLKRYIDYTGAEYERVNDRVTFTDADSISAYAAEAVAEMAGYGIIHGRDTGEFDPKSGTTRAECATVVMNFMNLPDAPNEPDASNAL